MDIQYPRSSMGDHVWNSHVRNKNGYVANFTDGAWSGWQARDAEIAQLREQLAAREAVIARLLGVVGLNRSHHQDYDDYGGYPESELCEKNTMAIVLTASPQEALIAALKTARVGALRAAANEIAIERFVYSDAEWAVRCNLAEGLRDEADTIERDIS